MMELKCKTPEKVFSLFKMYYNKAILGAVGNDLPINRWLLQFYVQAGGLKKCVGLWLRNRQVKVNKQIVNASNQKQNH